MTRLEIQYEKLLGLTEHELTTIIVNLYRAKKINSKDIDKAASAIPAETQVWGASECDARAAIYLKKVRGRV